MARRKPQRKDRSRTLQAMGESLLAAPDATRLSENERNKHDRRKALAAAEDAQLLAGKSEERPTDEDLLADIYRVATDEKVNPFWRDKTVSAKRYKRFGHYPISFIHERYGQFEHAKQVAGLADKPGTRKTKAATAARSRKQHADRYMQQTMMPHALDAPELVRELGSTKLVLTISDVHATYLDPFTWWAFLGACGVLSPDMVILNGDGLEGSSISRYPKIPGSVIPLQVEFDFQREMFKQLREVCGPDTDIVLTAGNHDLDRWAMHLTQTDPAACSLRSMRFDKLLGLDELNVKLSIGGKALSPEGSESELPGLLLHGFYYIHHGTKLGATPAQGELRACGYSGQSGHVHRAQMHFGTTLSEAGKSWMCTPMACTDTAGRGYIKSPTAGWQKGFGVAFLMPCQRVHQYPVLTDGGMCIVEGHHFEMRRMPKDQDITTNWLENFEVPS